MKITTLAIFVSIYFLFSLLNEEKEGTDLVLLNTNSIKNRFNCHYSILWCGCYSQSTSQITGCQVSCSPTYSHSTYNSSACPHYKQFFLSGFSTV